MHEFRIIFLNDNGSRAYFQAQVRDYFEARRLAAGLKVVAIDWLRRVS